MQEVNKPEVSVCIVSYNNEDCIEKAFSSIIENSKNANLTLYLSDNNSTDKTVSLVKKISDDIVVLENGGNIGFGKAHNAVISLLASKYHIVVNPDISLSEDTISALCDYLDNNPDVSLCIPKIVFPDGEEQVLPKKKPKFKYLLARRVPFFKKYEAEYTMRGKVFSEPTEIDFCTGCFMFMRTEVFKKLNGFDERFFMYFEDADLTLRAKKYGKTMIVPGTKVIHAWHRDSAKSLKYLMIHISSMFKFFFKHRKV